MTKDAGQSKLGRSTPEQKARLVKIDQVMRFVIRWDMQGWDNEDEALAAEFRQDRGRVKQALGIDDAEFQAIRDRVYEAWSRAESEMNAVLLAEKKAQHQADRQATQKAEEERAERQRAEEEKNRIAAAQEREVEIETTPEPEPKAKDAKPKYRRKRTTQRAKESWRFFSDDFPDYEVSSHGRVRHKGRSDLEAVLKPSWYWFKGKTWGAKKFGMYAAPKVEMRDKEGKRRILFVGWLMQRAGFLARWGDE